MRGVRVEKSGNSPKFLSKKQLYIIGWLLGFAVLATYGIGLIIERTAPVNPATGFHISVVGAFLFMLYPMAVMVQVILIVAGLVLAVMGLIGKRAWLWAGLGLLALGGGFMLLNYIY